MHAHMRTGSSGGWSVAQLVGWGVGWLVDWEIGLCEYAGFSKDSEAAEDKEGNCDAVLVGLTHHVQIPLQTKLQAG